RRISEIERIANGSLGANRASRSKALVDRSEDLAEEVTKLRELLVAWRALDHRFITLALEVGYMIKRVIHQGFFERRDGEILRRIGEREPEQICCANGGALIDEIGAAGREKMEANQSVIAHHPVNPPQVSQVCLGGMDSKDLILEADAFFQQNRGNSGRVCFDD